MTEIQPSDPRARRIAIWVVAIALVLGVCAILLFEYFYFDIQSWLQRNIDYLTRNKPVVFLAALALISPVLAAGVFLFILGDRIVRSRRFPPPNYAVSRDTRVLRGAMAVTRGRIVQMLSLLLIFAAGAIPFFVWAMFHALAGAA